MNSPKNKRSERDGQLAREVMQFNVTPTPKRDRRFRSLDEDLRAQDARNVATTQEEQIELSERARDWLDSADLVLNSSAESGALEETLSGEQAAALRRQPPKPKAPSAETKKLRRR